MKILRFLSCAALLVFYSCSKNQADLIVYNAKVYTVDSLLTVTEAFAVKDGKFIETGTSDEILKKYDAAEVKDAQGKAVFPGFIDAHCHFYFYGLNSNNIDLVGTKSFNEVVERVTDYAKDHPEGWLVGRGWDQNDWDEKSFPVKDTFDKLFPGRPMYLSRVDGHAALVNQDAIDQAKFDIHTKITGGDIVKINGKLSGVLLDNAADSVQKLINKPTRNQQIEALQKAEQDCFGVGLTTVSDAGLDKQVVLLIDSLQKANQLQMRVYAMLNPTEENFKAFLSKGIYATDWLNVRSFKIYGDGALGSRGACLLHPYSDKPETHGFLISPPKYFQDVANKIKASDYQMNTHCIGDSANRWLLKTYAQVLGKNNNRRWRIEHAQVVNANDFHFFKDYNIIPSVQPTHATSDMYWAEDRLGKNRMNGAYAYKQLLINASVLAGGSDFPVEGINPLLGFYAAVARQDAKGFPENGFRTEDALTRQEALRSMTIWAAYSNFEEKQKGSIEKGKIADFVLLDKDIMQVELPQVLNTKVLETYSSGRQVYLRK